MIGKPEVLKVLQEALTDELGAVHGYILHAEMCESWGYKTLAGATTKRAIEEMKHAEKHIARIIFLEGQPLVSELNKVHIGEQLIRIGRSQVGNYRLDFDLRIDGPHTLRGGDSLGRGSLCVVLVEQQLALQIAEFYAVAVDHADESDARPRQHFGLCATQAAASHYGDAALQNAILSCFADFTVTNLTRVALIFRGSHLLTHNRYKRFPNYLSRSGCLTLVAAFATGVVLK